MVRMGVGGVVMVMILSVGDRYTIGLTGSCALVFTELTGLSQAFDVVMVTVLGSTNLRFKTEHLLAVFAQRAIHRGVAADHLFHPLLEGLDHQGVITQVARLEHLHLGMIRCDPLAVLANATDQHP